jgi:hypothetical protein
MNIDGPPRLPPDDEPPPLLEIPAAPDGWRGNWPTPGTKAYYRMQVWLAWDTARSEADGIGRPVYVEGL